MIVEQQLSSRQPRHKKNTTTTAHNCLLVPRHIVSHTQLLCRRRHSHQNNSRASQHLPAQSAPLVLLVVIAPLLSWYYQHLSRGPAGGALSWFDEDYLLLDSVVGLEKEVWASTWILHVEDPRGGFMYVVHWYGMLVEARLAIVTTYP